MMNIIDILPNHLASPARYSFLYIIQPILHKYISQEDKVVLDFGCGSGVWRFLFYEGNSMQKKYVGFDYNYKSSDFAEKNGENVSFLIADGMSVPFKDGSFDFVLNNAVFEHIIDDRLAIRESLRVLKSNKYCCVIVPTNLAPIYDELPFLPLRIIGLRKGHGDHYYSRRHIVGKLEDAGFKVENVTLSLGFFGLILKTLYMYPRILMWYGIVFVNKLLNINHYISIYGRCGHVWNARSMEELLRICEEERNKMSIWHKLYKRLLEFAVLLDKYVPIPFGGEWCILCKKL